MFKRLFFTLILAAAAAQAHGAGKTDLTPYEEYLRDGAGEQFLAFASTRIADAKLRTFVSDSQTLFRDQRDLAARVESVRSVLATSAAGMGMLSKLDADLKRLESGMKTLDSTAKAAEAIPQASEKARKVRSTLAPALENVTAARQRLDAIVAKTEPVRIKFESAAEKARKLRVGLKLLNEVVMFSGKSAFKVDDCLPKMRLEKRPCVEGKAHDLYGAADAVYADYDKVVKALLFTPGPWLPDVSFFNPFNDELRAVKDLLDDIDALCDQVDALNKYFKGVNDVLDMSFSFSFPYPTLTGFSNYRVSISFRTIAEGTGAIEAKIRDILSGFLWDTLKALGVGSYIRSLQNQADDAMRRAIDALGVSLDIALPDMAALGPFDSLDPNIEVHIDGLAFPSIGADLKGFGLPGADLSLDYNLPAGLRPYGDGCGTLAALCK